jgi:hypothetical protein
LLRTDSIARESHAGMPSKRPCTAPGA